MIWHQCTALALKLFLNIYDETKEPSSILYVDAKHLYGEVVLDFSLPLMDVEIVEEISIEEILYIDDEAATEYIVEADLDYLDRLHDQHSDFPLISDKEPLDPIELRDYQSELKTSKQ